MNKLREPSVSVIVPVYNGENRIVQCIESLLTRMYPSGRVKAKELKITKELLFCVR